MAWFYRYEDGKPIVRAFVSKYDTREWSEVPGDPVILNAIYEIGYEEGGDSVHNDHLTGRWASGSVPR